MLTSYGEIPLRGPVTARPKVLAIKGVFARPEALDRFDAGVGPAWDGLVADVPGNRTPHLSEASIPAWAAAFDEIVDRLGPTVVVGLSVGALVALAMRTPRYVIALEPPLRTEKLWPMVDELQRMLPTHPEHAPWIEGVFGVHPDRIEGRDYRPLLEDRPCPTEIVVGAEPLYPVRPVAHYPSFVDEPERAYAARFVPVHVVANNGHAISGPEGATALRTLISRAQERVITAASPI